MLVFGDVLMVMESCGMFRDAIDYTKPLMLGASRSGCSTFKCLFIGSFFGSYQIFVSHHTTFGKNIQI